MKDHKSIRAVLTEPEIIEMYEKELFEQDLTERELISRALRVYFAEQDRVRVR